MYTLDTTAIDAVVKSFLLSTFISASTGGVRNWMPEELHYCHLCCLIFVCRLSTSLLNCYVWLAGFVCRPLKAYIELLRMICWICVQASTGLLNCHVWLAGSVYRPLQAFKRPRMTRWICVQASKGLLNCHARLAGFVCRPLQAYWTATYDSLDLCAGLYMPI